MTAVMVGTPQRVRLGGDLFHPQVPAGAVNVARPTRWGNPHKVGKPCPRCAGVWHDQTAAVNAYAHDLLTGRLTFTIARARVELAGRDLACWCQPGQPCHADVLLTLATEGAHP